MVKQGVVETNVDLLMDLLAEKNYISISEAAKKLNVSQDVVEEWARLLEEEGVLHIKYQFTKPYIQFIAPAVNESVKEVKQESFVQVKTPKIVPQTNLNLGISENRNKERPRHTMIPSLSGGIKLGGERRSPLPDHPSPVTDHMNANVHQIHQELNQLPQKYLDHRRKLEEQIYQKVPQENHEEKVQSMCLDIKDMLSRGKSLLSNHDLSGAMQIYKEIHAHYEDMPPGYFENKNDLAGEIVSFYHDVTVKQYSSVSNAMEEKVKAINAFLDQSERSMLDGMPDEAYGFFDEAKNLFHDLPKGFLDKKTELQERMLTVWKSLAQTKKSMRLQTVTQSILSINEKIQRMQSSISMNDIPQAVNLYKEIRESYNSLPQGFASQDVQVLSNILNAYKDLVNAQRSYSSHTVKRMMQDVMNKISRARMESVSDIALEYYREAVDTYNRLPTGYDHTRLELRKNLYLLYHDLISKQDLHIHDLSPYAQERYFAVLKLLVKTLEALDEGKFSSLEELYKSLHSAYYEMPISVVRKRTALVGELKKIYHMYELYEKLQSVETCMQEGRRDEVPSLLEDVEKKRLAVAKEQQSSPLVQFVLSRAKDIRQELEKPPRATTDHAKLKQSLIASKRSHALQAMAEKRYEDAVAHLNALLELDPANKEAHYMLTIARGGSA